MLAALASVVVLAAEPCPAPALAAGQDPVDAVHAEVVGWINSSDEAALFGRFSGPMQAAVPAETTAQLVNGVAATGGCISRSTRTGGSERRGMYRLDAEKAAWQLDLHVDANGVIQGMKLGTASSPDPPVARSTLPQVLPVTGVWTVVWGGDTQDLNQHVTHPSQRRAADLLVTDSQGLTHAGDGKRLTDYYAYGRPVRAVADGVVVMAINGVPESEPGRLNPYFALGNAVIVRHEGGVHSMVAHLQPGTVRVKVGQRVRVGQELGRCGNTGNTTEPHVHFQLMDGQSVEASWGIEALFPGVAVTRDGGTTVEGEYAFRKGDLIEGR